MMGNVSPPIPSSRQSAGKGSMSGNRCAAWLQVMQTIAATFRKNDEMPRLLSIAPSVSSVPTIPHHSIGKKAV